MVKFTRDGMHLKEALSCVVLCSVLLNQRANSFSSNSFFFPGAPLQIFVVIMRCFAVELFQMSDKSTEDL